MASSERRREKYSTDDDSFGAARMPAVSMSLNGQYFPSLVLKVKLSSTASRVVPATSLTIRRSLLSTRLLREDLPTLGRPTKQIFRRSLSRSPISGGGPSFSSSALRTSASPLPCSAEM